ncbi:MAG TPA: hypothetical protein VL337_00730 [Acidimicrobiales bacterium]|jgi:hypothetical protein|nr:hypothetical protein [Acidimicrobiales bacterium]
MNRRAWTGVIAGVVAAFLLLGVASTAYEIGQRHEVVTRTVGNGEVVRVVGDGWGYGHGGFGFGFFLFPLLLIFLVFLAFRGRRGWYGGGGYGPCGPGPGAGEAGSFEERHRRAHEQGTSPVAAPGPGEAGEA